MGLFLSSVLILAPELQFGMLFMFLLRAGETRSGATGFVRAIPVS